MTNASLLVKTSLLCEAIVLILSILSCPLFVFMMFHIFMNGYSIVNAIILICSIIGIFGVYVMAEFKGFSWHLSVWLIFVVFLI